MKRFQLLFALLLPILAHLAYADSVTIFVAQANIGFGTDFYGGDNQSSTFVGPGVNLRAFGDLSCSWCGGFNLTPGSSITPSVGTGGLDWTFAQGNLTFDGQSQICGSDCGIYTTGITALGSFTLPANGRNFTVTVPAMLNGIVGVLGEGDTFQQFALQIPQGRLVLSFDFFPANGGFLASYQFTHGTFTTTPEPSTLGLMASGVAGIVGAVLRKRKIGHRST